MLSCACKVFNILIYIQSVLIYATGNNLYWIGDVSQAQIIGNDIFFEILEPKELCYTYRTRPARNFGASFNESFVKPSIPLVPAIPSVCCGRPINANELRGSVALVERGECSFVSKTLRAEEVGAVAVIISDYKPSNDDLFIEMLDDETLRQTNIPAAFLVGKNGYIIRKTLEKLHRNHALIRIPVNLTHVPIHKMKQPPWLAW